MLRAVADRVASNSVRHKSCLAAPDRFGQEFPSVLKGRERAIWSLHPGGNQKIGSWGPQKHPQDRRITLVTPLFWHAKHVQNTYAKIEPDTIGVAGVIPALPPVCG